MPSLVRVQASPWSGSARLLGSVSVPVILAVPYLAVTLSACVVESSSSVGSLEGGGSVLQGWVECGMANASVVECAAISVPLDHEKPRGAQIALALNRIRTSEEHRGSVLLNPGGPGSSGRDMLLGWAGQGLLEEIAPGFDLVGFDPRGVGGSARGTCSALPSLVDADAMGQSGMMDGTELSEAERVEAIGSFGRACRAGWGPLFDYMGSNQVVRDMEVIRDFLQEDTLNFLGVSYGTRLGALYAQTFPERVRAIVLDGPVLPTADTVALRRDQFEQTLSLHDAVFERCAQGLLRCPEDPRQVFDDLLASAELAGVQEQVLDLWLLGLTYGEALATLPGLLNRQAEAADEEWLQGVLAGLEERTGITPAARQGSEFVTNFAVQCADNTDYRLSVEEAEELVSRARAASPLFGYQMNGVGACTSWPVVSDPVPRLQAPDAPPLLVVGGLSDRLTPIAWAEEMDASLRSSVLLRSEHWGHGAVSAGSRCVREAIATYFTDLELPEAGAVCEGAVDLGIDLTASTP